MRVIDTSTLLTPADVKALSLVDQEYIYNGLDCAVTLEVYHALVAELDNVSSTIYERSIAMRAPILEMSLRGVRVDTVQRNIVLRQKELQHKQIDAAFHRIMREAFDLKINHRSNKDLQYLFYEILRLRPIKKRNAQGNFVPTVNRDALERLQENFFAIPLAQHILALRDLEKQITFLKTGIDADGRMRATFNIAGTKTGRLNSSMSEFGTGTNMQNIDRALRSIFIPDDGYVFVNIDLEQGDSRNLGAMCWEVFVHERGEAFAGAYLDACESGDLHTAVCRMAWRDLAWPEEGAPLAEFKKVAEQIFYRQDSYRQMAKKLGHGTNFVGTPRTMAMHTKMPVPIISDFQSRYFAAFPCIPAYHSWVAEQLRDPGYLITLHDRRRYFFGRADDPSTLREAVANTPQSMTADAVNKAMITIWRDGVAPILLQVHDSLLLQVREAELETAVPRILELGLAPINLALGRRFVVPNEAKFGYNWGDHDEEKNPNGLIKWKPGLNRKKTSYKFQLEKILCQET